MCRQAVCGEVACEQDQVDTTQSCDRALQALGHRLTHVEVAGGPQS
jgi:hypothetical protein